MDEIMEKIETQTNQPPINDSQDINTSIPPVPVEEAVESLREIFNNIFSRPTTNQLQINAIAKLPEVLALTNDLNLVRQVLAENKYVQISGDTVKSLLKLEQNTLILREVPEIVKDIDIRNFFGSARLPNGILCPSPQSVRLDLGETWFVTFATESEARLALQAVSGAEIHGQKVKARLKTESMAKYQNTPTNYASYPRGEQVPPGGNVVMPGNIFIPGFNSQGGPIPPVYGGQLIYPQNVIFPPPYNVALPPGSYPGFPVGQGPIGYPAMPGFMPIPPQQQGIPPGRGFPNYQNLQYQGGNKQGNRGNRYPRGPSSPRYANTSYRNKGEGEYPQGFDGRPGYNRGYHGPLQGDPAMQQFGFPPAGIFMPTGYGFVDPAALQQMQQPTQLLGSEISDSPSDTEGTTQREFIYLAGRVGQSTNSGLKSESGDKEDPNKVSNGNGTTPETNQISEGQPGEPRRGQIVKQTSYPARNREKGAPQYDGPVGEKGNVGRRGSGSGQNSGNRGSRTSNSNLGGSTDSAQAPPSPQSPHDGVNRRGNKNHRQNRNENDAASRSIAKAKPLPQFNLEADFPTLNLEEGAANAATENNNGQGAWKSGYAAALRNQSGKPSTPENSTIAASFSTSSPTSIQVSALSSTEKKLAQESQIMFADHPVVQSVESTPSIPFKDNQPVENQQVYTEQPTSLIFGSFNAVVPEVSISKSTDYEISPSGDQTEKYFVDLPTMPESFANSSIPASKRSFKDVLRAGHS